ncbi:E3 ubiquitin-protein ligase TRIM13-like [Asterias amurensis]|uniref:E3 ubiquitin-protein ligase TRIM13-like n=1 Tax=Asterias amurensis TaxID=7602 RepID=UPI003AB10EFA
MASSKLHDVMTKLTQNHLTCTICLSTFTDPRILDCNHSYCLTCLKNLETKTLEDGELSSQLKCPICRKMTSLNEMGADGLKRNFTLKSLQADILYQQNLMNDEPKAACSHYDARSHSKESNGLQADNLNQDSVEKVPSQPKTQCQRHPNQDYCLYCMTYSVLICEVCTATTHRDLDHIHLELDEAEKTCRTELVELLTQSLDRVCHLTAIKSLIENERDKMNNTVDAVVTPDFETLLEEFREDRVKKFSLLLSSANSKVEWAAQAYFNVLKKVTEACMYDLLETREELALRLKDVIQKEFPSMPVPTILEIKLKSKLKFGFTVKHLYEIHITETDCYIDNEGKIIMGKPRTETIK